MIQLFPYAALFIATLLLYGKSIGFGFIASWDDRDYVINNALIRGITLKNIGVIFSTTTLGHYAPVHIMSYAVDYALWGLNPWGYHLFNVVLHGFNACLAYLLLLKFTKNKYPAFFSALLFVVHPLNVENVAWVSERKSLLASVFFLLAIASYVKFRESSRARFYFFCIFLFVLSVLSKASTVILPFVLISYDVYIRKQKMKWQHFIPLIAIFFSGMAVTLWAHFITKAIDKGTLSYDLLFKTVYPTMTVVYWKYVRLVIAPINLSGFYDAVIQKSFLAWPPMISILAWLCLFFIVITRGSSQLKFWFLWFWICFLPTANIIPIPVYYADRYMYMPAIGFFAIIGLGMNAVITRFKANSLVRFTAYGTAGCILLFYSVASYKRLDVWKNELTFWEDTVAKSPNQDRAHLNLGTIYEMSGRFIEAEQEYRKAIAVYPSDDALYNLKMVRAKIEINNSGK